jgi:hypothetical protein
VSSCPLLPKRLRRAAEGCARAAQLCDRAAQGRAEAKEAGERSGAGTLQECVCVCVSGAESWRRVTCVAKWYRSARLTPRATAKERGFWVETNDIPETLSA